MGATTPTLTFRRSPQPDHPFLSFTRMKRLLRSLSKRSLGKEEKYETDISLSSKNLQRDSLWSVVEDEPWSYNRLKDDEAAEKRSAFFLL